MVATRAQSRSSAGPSSDTPQLKAAQLSVPPRSKREIVAKETRNTISTELDVRHFKSAADLEAFLDEEHETCPGIWLKIARKGSGITSITHAEAIPVLLCFGWIDGQGKGFDDKFHLCRLTPRRAKSIWSQINVKHVERLTEEGRMRPAGIAVVNAAKADGRWARAYSSPSTISVPADLQKALDETPAASAFFAGLNKGNRYKVLWRLETASQNTRASKIIATVEMLTAGKVPGEKAVKTSSQTKDGRGVSVGKVSKARK